MGIFSKLQNKNKCLKKYDKKYELTFYYNLTNFEEKKRKRRIILFINYLDVKLQSSPKFFAFLVYCLIYLATKLELYFCLYSFLHFFLFI